MDQSNNKRAGRWRLLAVLAVCASPLILSYLAYYVIKPTGRTNYGEILDPRKYPIPDLASTSLDGKAQGLDAYKGKWLLVKVGPGACAEACKQQLFFMRQLRTMQGKEMERVERVWLIDDAAPLDAQTIREYDGMRHLRVSAAAVQKWLPLEAGEKLDEHLFLIDPLGNLMMRFPKDPEPKRVHGDLKKLLKASGIG